MGIRDAVELFMALSPLQESVIKATDDTNEPIKLKHRFAILDATFQGSSAEIVCYLRSRLGSPNWITVWKSLFMIHLMLNEGQSESVRDALSDDRKLFELPDFISNSEASPQSNVWAYARYLQVRIQISQAHNHDFCIPSSTRPDFRNGTVKSFLENGTFEALLCILDALSCLKFYRDDFDNGAVLEAARTIFDDFLLVYCDLTMILINLLCQCNPINDEIKPVIQKILSRYRDIHGSLSGFLQIMERVESFLNQPVPSLLPIPDFNF